MIGIHKISACIKGEKTKMESMQESIQQLFEIVNLYENNNKNIDMVSVNDLNLVIDDVRESFQIFLNNTPRDNNEDIKTELETLKREILALREIINNNKPVVEEVEKPIIELDNTMIVQRKLPKLNLVKKGKTFSNYTYTILKLSVRPSVRKLHCNEKN